MKVVIVGSRGQDGKILSEIFLKRNYEIIGIHRDGIDTNNTDYLGPVNLSDFLSIENLIREFKPDHLYYLAAYHQSAEKREKASEELIKKSYEINVIGYAYFLEAVKNYSPTTRIFYAASSHIFLNTSDSPQSEETQFAPGSIYGISKVSAIQLSQMYIRNYNLCIAVGLLYNHESRFRQSDFISSKIINGALLIKEGKLNQISLKNLEVKVDWGYAEDYMDAAISLLEANKSGEFLIASGNNHSVQEFVELVFNEFNLDWKKYVVSEKLDKIERTNSLVGNIDKIRKEIGWKPKTSFEDMIVKLVNEKKRMSQEAF